MHFTEVYLGEVEELDFRKNARQGDLGTRTATLHKDGIAKLRGTWIYKVASTVPKNKTPIKPKTKKA